MCKSFYILWVDFFLNNFFKLCLWLWNTLLLALHVYITWYTDFLLPWLLQSITNYYDSLFIVFVQLILFFSVLKDLSLHSFYLFLNDYYNIHTFNKPFSQNKTYWTFYWISTLTNDRKQIFLINSEVQESQDWLGSSKLATPNNTISHRAIL